jgi:hypothetical protein
MIDFNALPLLVNAIEKQYLRSMPLSQWIEGTMTPSPSTPIDEYLKDCTAAERKAIAERTPPYDGVRTWGDLEVVRAKAKTPKEE